jgi:hypothetical protein
MLTDLAEGLGAFSDGSLVALGSLFAAGAIFGATGLAGPSTLGIGAIGVGIGAFLLGLSGAAAIINLFGGGPKLKELLVNLAEGLGAFSNIDAGNLLKIAGTLPIFGASMLAFFGLAGIGGVVQSLAGGMKGLMDFIFGTEKKSPMQKLSEDLQLFQNINGDNLSKIGQGMKDLASGMLGLAKLTDEDLAKVNKAAAIAKSTAGVNAVGTTQPSSTFTSTPGAKYNPAADSQAANTPAPTSTATPQPPTTSPTKSSTTPITTGPGGAAFGMYPKPGGKNPLLDMIAQGESTGAGGYNAMNQGTPGGGPVIGSGDSQKIIQKKLTDMTVGEIMDKGAKPNDDAAKRKQNGLIFAAGRYQIVPETLKGLVKQGVVSKEDKFNEETQDKLGTALIKGTGALKLAESGDYEGAQNALAKTWASIPLATDVGDKKAGQSYYQKAGQNTAHSGLNVKDALMASAGTLSPNQSAALTPNAPSSATTLAAATTAVSQEKMTLASAAPVVNNVTNNNVNNSTSGGGSSTSTASVYDDLFTKLVGRALT